MSATPPPSVLRQLATRLTGELHFDATMRAIYATDSSEYQALPVAVALPKTETDLRELISFAREHHLGLIPRTAGTSSPVKSWVMAWWSM